MKVTTTETVHIRDVSTDGILRLDALFNFFQEMAVFHTHEVGIELKDLIGSGKTWVLNRVVAEISQLPRLEESIELSTWSRKLHRFKGVREFEIFIQGYPIIQASSMWVFVDIKKGRPTRVPADYEDRYGIVEQQATTADVEKLQFESITKPDFSLNIATRIADYDINGHVNNTALLQYIETALVRFCAGEVRVNKIQLIFMKEIPLSIGKVTVLLQKTTHGCLFEIVQEDAVFVRGNVGNQSNDGL